MSLASRINDKLIAGVNAILAQALAGQESEAPLLAANPMLVEITDLKIRLLVACRRYGIVIQKLTTEHTATEATIHLTGTSQTLMQLAIATDKQEAITTQQGLHLSGNTAALYAWQRAWKNLSIHWEKELVRHIGALPASVLIHILRRVKAGAQRLNEQLPPAVQHRLVESDMAVHNTELDTLGKDMQSLRLEVDKLRRRIDRLTIHHKAPENH